MILKSLGCSVGTEQISVCWLNGEMDADYNNFRSSEKAVPEFYETLGKLGKKLLEDYLKLRANAMEENVRLDQITVVKVTWSYPKEVKNFKYKVGITLLYQQGLELSTKIQIPKIGIPAWEDDKLSSDYRQAHYEADKEMERILERLEELGKSYAMGERAQMEITGIKE